MLRPSTTIPARGHGPLWRDPRVRAFALQALMLIGVIAIVLTNNILTNLAQRGIATGFAYLDQRAGFGIAQSLVNYSSDSTYGDAFKVGL